MATKEKKTKRLLPFEFTAAEWDLFDTVKEFRPGTIKSSLMLGLKHYEKIIERELQKTVSDIGPLDAETEPFDDLENM